MKTGKEKQLEYRPAPPLKAVKPAAAKAETRLAVVKARPPSLRSTIQRGAGNAAIQRAVIQRKAANSSPAKAKGIPVSQPGDRSEHEAERMAEKVMRSPGGLSLPTAPPAAPSRPAGLPDGVRSALASDGRPLDPASRAFFEPRIGVDLSGVRVHTGREADQSAHDLEAKAYTVGSDIVFRQGHHDPSSSAGRELLAHELTHVVKQNEAHLLIQRKPAPVSPPQPAPKPLQFERMTHGALEFRSPKDFDDFKSSQPAQSNWALVALPNQRFGAFPLDERALQNLSDEIRHCADPFGIAGGRIEKLFLNGTQYSDAQVLYSQYFRSDSAAFIAFKAEGEIYRMGSESFGFLKLDHAVAIQRWLELEELSDNDPSLSKVYTQPNSPFVALKVRVTGNNEQIDSHYFAARRLFFQVANSDIQMWVYEGEFNYQLNRRILPFEVLEYIQIQEGRERPDPRFMGVMERDPLLTQAIGNDVIRRASVLAFARAATLLQQAAEPLVQLVHSQELVQQFVIGFSARSPDMQQMALDLFGLEPKEKANWQSILTNPGKVAQIYGDPEVGADGLTIGKIQSKAAEHIQNLQKTVTQLNEHVDQCLYLEGEFGKDVRAYVYKELGFTRLHPENFPHDKEIEPPDKNLIEKPESFTNLGEMLYGRLLANEARRNRVLQYIAIAGVIMASVAALLAAGALGILAAELLFGGGSVGLLSAYTLTEMGVSSLAYTGFSKGMEKLFDLPPEKDAHGFFAEWGINFLTFYGFNVVGRMATRLASLAVGSKPLAALTKGQRALFETVRVSTMALTFTSYGVAQFYRKHGRYPQGEELSLFVYQNVLSLTLMEAGAVLARPLMNEIQLSAFMRRMDEFLPNIYRQQMNAREFLRRVGEFSASQGSRDDANALRTEFETLAKEREALIEKIRAAGAREGDVKRIEDWAQAEMAAVRDARTAIERVEFHQEIGLEPEPSNPNVFYFDEAKAGRLPEYYGKENVSGPDAEGTYRVKTDGQELILMPREAGGTAEAKSSSPAVRQQALENMQALFLDRAHQILESRPRNAKDDGAIDELKDLIKRIGSKRLKQQKRLGTLDETAQLLERGLALVEQISGVAIGARARQGLEPPIPLAVRQQTLQGMKYLFLERAEQILESRSADVQDNVTAELRDLVKRLSESRPTQQKDPAKLRETTRLLERGMQLVEQMSGVGISPRARQGLEALGRALAFGTFTSKDAKPVEMREIIARLSQRTESPDEMNYILETYGLLVRQGVSNTNRVLRDMVTGGAGKWVGGLWALTFARDVVGVSEITSFEVWMSANGSGGRFVDVLLKSGRRVELKDWNIWQVGKVESQFTRDLEILIPENQSTSPEALKKLLWIFRNSPLSVVEIRSIMRRELVALLLRRGISGPEQQAWLDAFDAQDDLVRVWNAPLFSSSVTPISVPTGADTEDERKKPAMSIP